jgi:hypothetical protein
MSINCKGPAMKTLDEMTLDELRALETERFGQYEDQYNHASHEAALPVRYFEIVAVICDRLRRGLDSPGTRVPELFTTGFQTPIFPHLPVDPGALMVRRHPMRAETMPA